MEIVATTEPNAKGDGRRGLIKSILMSRQSRLGRKFHGNSPRLRVVRPVDLLQMFGLRLQTARGPSLGIAFGF